MRRLPDQDVSFAHGREQLNPATFGVTVRLVVLETGLDLTCSKWNAEIWIPPQVLLLRKRMLFVEALRMGADQKRRAVEPESGVHWDQVPFRNATAILFGVIMTDERIAPLRRVQDLRTAVHKI